MNEQPVKTGKQESPTQKEPVPIKGQTTPGDGQEDTVTNKDIQEEPVEAPFSEDELDQLEKDLENLEFDDLGGLSE